MIVVLSPRSRTNSEQWPTIFSENQKSEPVPNGDLRAKTALVRSGGCDTGFR
jgi:hypothetical protein